MNDTLPGLHAPLGGRVFKDPFDFILLTVGTDPFDDEIDILRLKALGQPQRRYGHILQAIGLPAFYAIEMIMLVLHRTGAILIAQGIFHCSGAIVHTVDQQMVLECFQGPEHRRAINVLKLLLYLHKAHGLPLPAQHLIHQPAHGRGPDIPVLQRLVDLILHIVKISNSGDNSNTARRHFRNTTLMISSRPFCENYIHPSENFIKFSCQEKVILSSNRL